MHAMTMSRSGLLVGLLAGIGGYLWWSRRGDGEIAHHPAAAFAGEGAAVGSPVHTRDAGPDHMRDDHPHWDSVDEAADESFPASDPPSTY